MSEREIQIQIPTGNPREIMVLTEEDSEYVLAKFCFSNIDDFKKTRIPRGRGRCFMDGKDQQSVIYFQVDFNKKEVYVGETKRFYNRITDHKSKKDLSNSEIIVFTNISNSIGTDKRNFLEAKCINHLRRSDSMFTCPENKSMPLPKINTSHKNQMKKAFDFLKLYLDILGIDLFEKSTVAKQLENIEENNLNKNHSKYYYIEQKREGVQISAKGFATGNGKKFVVFSGSDASKSTFNRDIHLKERLIRENILEDRKNKYVFTKDYEFSSSSMAARIVLGRSASGNVEWKLKSK